MKRWICMLLCLGLLGCLFGCTEETPEAPVEFFYLYSSFDYSTDGTVIGSEIRESAGLEDYRAILDLYLQGPASEGLSTTFPKDCRIVSLSQGDNSVSLVVSDAFAALTGIDLTAACICLTKTVIQLTGCAAVTIQAETLTLDGSKNITMNETGVLLLDGYYGQTESE